MPDDVRILLFADSHLGLDLPMRPRTDRRRRGHDFLANYDRVLSRAREREVDIVVHCGDVFDRPTIPPAIARLAYEPLRRVADLGVPILIVPGNHERSRLPHSPLLAHSNIHIFDRPRTTVLSVRGRSVAFSGFPYERRDVRAQFRTLLEQTRWHDANAQTRILCVHHCVEGATVGPANYMFTTASDVIRHCDVPSEFTAVFTGHVHRHQHLTTGLEGKPLATPVFYPGSIERTSFAEADETKGFVIVRLDARDAAARSLDWEFCPLPARPMVRIELVATSDECLLERALSEAIASAPADAVLTLRIHGELTDAQWRVLSAERIRALAPATMNVDVVPVDRAASMRRPRREVSGGVRRDDQVALEQLTLI